MELEVLFNSITQNLEQFFHIENIPINLPLWVEPIAIEMHFDPNITLAPDPNIPLPFNKKILDMNRNDHNEVFSKVDKGHYKI